MVKINEKWYNADLTWDASNIKDGSTPNYCLQSKEEFQHDEYTVKEKIPNANVSYDQDEICKYFSSRSFTIDTEEQPNKEILEIVKELQNSTNYISDGIDIKLISIYGKQYPETGAVISNIVNGYCINSKCNEPLIINNQQELIKLVNEVINDKGTIMSKVLEDGNTKLSNEGNINLTLDSEVKEFLKLNGIDIDNIVHTEYEITSNNLMKTNQNLQQKTEKQEVAMVEYKNSFIKKIFNNMKKIYNKMREKAQLGKKKVQKSEEHNINIKKEKNEKKPSWDLSNWTQEEIQKATQSDKQQVKQSIDEKMTLDR